VLGRIGAAGQREGAAVARVGAAGEGPQEVAIQVGDADQLGLAGEVGGGDGVPVLIHFHGQDIGQQQGGARLVGADGAGADEDDIIPIGGGDFPAVDARQCPGLRTTRENDPPTHPMPCVKEVGNL
jgi:hypothetical protein